MLRYFTAAAQLEDENGSFAVSWSKFLIKKWASTKLPNTSALSAVKRRGLYLVIIVVDMISSNVNVQNLLQNLTFLKISTLGPFLMHSV